MKVTRISLEGPNGEAILALNGISSSRVLVTGREIVGVSEGWTAAAPKYRAFRRVVDVRGDGAVAAAAADLWRRLEGHMGTSGDVEGVMMLIQRVGAGV